MLDHPYPSSGIVLPAAQRCPDCGRWVLIAPEDEWASMPTYALMCTGCPWGTGVFGDERGEERPALPPRKGRPA